MIRALVLVATLLCSALAAPAVVAQAASGAALAATASDLAGEAALSRLLAVLQDDDARAALVAALEGAIGGMTSLMADEAPPEEDALLAQRLALAGVGLADALRAEAERLWLGLVGLRDLVDRLPAPGPDERRAASALLATILATIAAALTFGAGSEAVARRLKPAADVGVLRRVGWALLALLAHLVGMALAWATGNAVALLLFSEGGQPWGTQVLYLDAFLAFGVARVALRAAANPDADREPALSLLRPQAQRVLYRSLRPVLGILVQGFLFVVPLIHLWAGFAAARPARTLVTTVAAIAALRAIWRVRRTLDATRPSLPPTALTDEPAGADAAPSAGVAEGLGSAWRTAWPPLAVLYVLYAWVVAITRPALADRIVLGGTVASLVAVLLVALGLHVLGRARLARVLLPLRAHGPAHAPAPG